MAYRLLPEWAHQASVLIVIPPMESDWAYCYEDVLTFYIRLIDLVSDHQHTTVTYTDLAIESKLPKKASIDYFHIPTNDTWVRDFGPITVRDDRDLVFLDFGFNGWGLKFASDLDNQFTKALKAQSFSAYSYQLADMVLEGGSIEYDDNGTLMTTSECLLSPNRNPWLTKADVEERMKSWFGVEQVLWLDHGYLAGDDTDSHIDTLARFCTADTIAYVQCCDPKDEHYEALRAMEEQLKTFRDKEGNPYRLVPLPMTDPIFDAEDGHRLPATYANFLIMNDVVIMPTYGDPHDSLAQQQLQSCFIDKKVVTIDCSVLIRQHGSLHCSTMQIPQ